MANEISELKLWRYTLERLTQSHPVILLCVLESKGSSPGRQGFKMAVASDGMTGSIGGGIMEYKFVEMAREKLNAVHDETVLRKQMHNKTAGKNQSGMICSGEQTIVLFHLTRDHVEIIKSIVKSLEGKRNGLLKITPDKIIFSDDIETLPDYNFKMSSEEEWEYIERTGFKNFLNIIGGGHCSLAFSQLMSKMDFFIRIYEERKYLNTFKNNDFVHEKILVPDYHELKNLLPEGKNHFTVVMTFGYRTDDIALRAIIEKEFRYLGILGSESKMKKLFEEWRKDNLPEEKLKKIHAPIGLNIYSQTPEEIGISIAGEIISVKNRR